MDGYLSEIDSNTLEEARAHLSRKKRFWSNEYGGLVDVLLAGRTNLTWLEVAQGQPGQHVTMVRHDIDHDFETALRIARWEHDRGIRATYCVLPSAWYYWCEKGSTRRRTTQMVECCRDIQTLGHEVSLHNNFVATALRDGTDPYESLGAELDFLRSRGIDIRGTSTHGDPLCRIVDFRNFELFAECAYSARGGPRVLRHQGVEVAIGQVSMREFDLEYEAYDFVRDLYVTDSGGNLRIQQSPLGRAGRLKDDLPWRDRYQTITGMLVHPVWWDFERQNVDAEGAAPTIHAAELASTALLASAGNDALNTAWDGIPPR